MILHNRSLMSGSAYYCALSLLHRDTSRLLRPVVSCLSLLCLILVSYPLEWSQEIRLTAARNVAIFPAFIRVSSETPGPKFTIGIAAIIHLQILLWIAVHWKWRRNSWVSEGHVCVAKEAGCRQGLPGFVRMNSVLSVTHCFRINPCMWGSWASQRWHSSPDSVLETSPW